MKPSTIDLSNYLYCTGQTHYYIDLAAYKNAVSIDLEIRSTEEVTVQFILSGSNEVLNFDTGKNIKIKIAIFNCVEIRLKTKKLARLAYICRATRHGGYEIMDPTPVAITAAKSEFTLTDMVRRELNKRLHKMGMAQEDVDDLLDEEDFQFDEDDDEELPEDTAYTEMEEETVHDEPDDTDPDPKPDDPPQPGLPLTPPSSDGENPPDT